MLSRLLLIVFFVFISSESFATDYWISKTGNNSNNCKTETTGECASINKVLMLAVAGDRIYIKPGTYIENSTQSPFTAGCAWFDAKASLCINSSGTKDNPILISAAPGALDGSVIIDSENSRVGVVMLAHDYITFRGLTFINNMKNGIANGSQAGNDVADPDLLSIGVIVENCRFDKVTTPDAGDNIAAIGMWSTKDWIVRNNIIKNVSSGSGIRSYGLINALIEHNTISDVSEGIMWKDHFVGDSTNRTLLVESEIRYNLIKANRYGILIQIRGDGTPEAGHNNIHHNIIYGLNGSEPAGVRVAMAGARALSGDLKFTNNLVDCSDGTQTVGVTVDSSTNVQFFGNIFLKCGAPFETIKYSDTKVARITASNYNLFIDAFSTAMDRYSNTSIGYTSLSSWQTAKDSSSISLAMDNPDTNSKSITLADAKFLSNVSRLYTPQLSSPIIKMLPDSTNVGPYQSGDETIGVIDPALVKSPPQDPCLSGACKMIQ
jgi:hypothetical protein